MRQPRFSAANPGRRTAAVLASVAALLAVLSAAPAKADEAAVRTAEARRYRAMVQNDLATLADLLDDDLVYTHSHGGVDDKASFLAALQSGALRYVKIEIHDTVVHAWGSAAVVTGAVTLQVQVGGRRVIAPSRFTAVYRQRDGGPWRLAAWQSTLIRGADDDASQPLQDRDGAAAQDAGGGTDGTADGGGEPAGEPAEPGKPADGREPGTRPSEPAGGGGAG